MVTVDRAERGWYGQVGVVTALIPRADFDPANRVVMICGPEIMMRFTVRELEKRGISEAQVFVSMERNMKCGLGSCGHCQFGPTSSARMGPSSASIASHESFGIREI